MENKLCKCGNEKPLYRFCGHENLCERCVSNLIKIDNTVNEISSIITKISSMVDRLMDIQFPDVTGEIMTKVLPSTIKDEISEIQKSFKRINNRVKKMKNGFTMLHVYQIQAEYTDIIHSLDIIQEQICHISKQ